MNQLLVRTLRAINSLIAFTIILAGTLAGAALGPGPMLMGALFGAVAGLLLATLINGAIAIILEIERHLREIKENRLDRRP